MNEAEFRILDHTSDIGIEAYGSTTAECFENAARGMFHLIAPELKARPLIRRNIEVDADGLEGLLVAWLSELLYLFDTEALFPGEYEIADITGEKLSAVVAGEVIDRTARCQREIKAVTYHLLEVSRVSSGQNGNCRWMARVVFDI